MLGTFDCTLTFFRIKLHLGILAVMGRFCFNICYITLHVKETVKILWGVEAAKKSLVWVLFTKQPSQYCACIVQYYCTIFWWLFSEKLYFSVYLLILK